MNIGANIRAIREEKGLTQTQLAERINVTQSMLCQIERGSKPPTLPLSIEIAAALGCDINRLTSDEV